MKSVVIWSVRPLEPKSDEKWAKEEDEKEVSSEIHQINSSVQIFHVESKANLEEEYVEI